jgi:predicted HicB family RNase H-like nuclease
MAKTARPQKRLPLRDARINIRLSDDLHSKLVELAQKESRSLSRYIERILDRHVTDIKRR